MKGRGSKRGEWENAGDGSVGSWGSGRVRGTEEADRESPPLSPFVTGGIGLGGLGGRRGSLNDIPAGDSGGGLAWRSFVLTNTVLGGAYTVTVAARNDNVPAPASPWAGAPSGGGGGAEGGGGRLVGR